jgi:hypothetical protein
MKKITYLIGAGASAEAIPTVNNISYCLRKLNDRLLSLFNSPSHPEEIHNIVNDAKKNKDFIEEIIKEFEILSK